LREAQSRCKLNQRLNISGADNMAKPGTSQERIKSDGVAPRRLFWPTAGLLAAILLAVLSSQAEAQIGASPPLLVAQSSDLLAEIGRKSQWAIGGPAICRNPNDANFYSLAVGSDAITWVNGLGSVDIESIVFSGDDEFHTTTRISQHVGSKNVRVGQLWTYSRVGERIRVRRVGGAVFMLTRCS
jgi:hypothetical protein